MKLTKNKLHRNAYFLDPIDNVGDMGSNIFVGAAGTDILSNKLCKELVLFAGLFL